MSEDGRAVYEDLVGRPWPSLTAVQRAVVGFGSPEIEVNNGGFQQFFYNSAGDFAVEALDAAKSLNLAELAAVLQRAMDLLPDGYSPDRTTRQAALKSIERTVWDPLNTEFDALERQVDFDSVLSTLASGA